MRATCACFPLPVRTIVASGTARRTSSTIAEPARSSSLADPDSATASRSGVASAPHPRSRNPRTAASGWAPPETVRSRTGPVPYQASPVSPASPAADPTSPIFAAPRVARSRSSPSVAITGCGDPGPKARTTLPVSLLRMSAPVMPCCEGRPPVPIVASTATGSSGTEPATAAPDASPRPCSIGRPPTNVGRGDRAMSERPIPFDTTRTTSGAFVLLRTTPGIAVPARTSGCARCSPSSGSRVGAT